LKDLTDTLHPQVPAATFSSLEPATGWAVSEPAAMPLNKVRSTVPASQATLGLLGATRLQLLGKRAMDVLGALAILMLAGTVMVLIALAVKVTSRGPVLFVQERVGKDGALFPLLKFRSMYTDAPELLADLADKNEVSGPVFKIRSDPRVTRTGQFIRRFSLDELPQLFNVLAGHMSLVGPRPAVPGEVAEYDGHQRRRLDVKPGLTCIWQVSGRSDVDFDTWVDMDLTYIRTWSLWLDVLLLARTIPAVLTGRGAY
jgi:lipopolysaccharide/colanic/teichoic acid biosynthesis glycosyltransferase